MTIATGYFNWDLPANKIVTPGEEIDNNTTWCGYE